MLVLDNSDAIRGTAEVASKLDFIVNGYVGTTATQLADGQLGNSEGDLYASGADATVVTSITVINTDSAARTFTLYLKPSGGTSRAISPVSLDLGTGYSFYTDGQRMVVMDTAGNVITAATAAAHKNNHDPEDGSDPLDTANAAEISVVVGAGTGSSHSLARADHVHAINHSLNDNHIVTIDGTTNAPANADYAKFTAGGLEGKTAAEVMVDLPAASTTAPGKSELATAAEINTGDDTGRTVAPKYLSDSNYGKRIMYVKVLANGTAVETGDGKAYVTIPIELNGMNLVLAHACVYTKSSSGLPAISLERSVDQGSNWTDMLSTSITIDENEFSSYTADTAPVIDTGEDNVATGYWIRVNVDTAGTGTKGLDVILTFQLP